MPRATRFAHPLTRLAAGSLVGLFAVGVGAVTHTAAAEPAPCSGTITASTTCTVAPGATVLFTLKGGNGGAGGTGGNGGSGGAGGANIDTMAPGGPGGLGGVGAEGGFGGAGAKISGSYTNSTGAAVTFTVTVGLDGMPGLDGFHGVNGALGVAGDPGTPGGYGGSGTDGGAGADGSPTEVYIDATLIARAGGGSGGTGGTGGTGGEGGAPGGGSGSAGAPGTPGATGVDGTVEPTPLPSGWEALATDANEAPFASFDQRVPTEPGSGGGIPDAGAASGDVMRAAAVVLVGGVIMAMVSRRRARAVVR